MWPVDLSNSKMEQQLQKWLGFMIYGLPEKVQVPLVSQTLLSHVLVYVASQWLVVFLLVAQWLQVSGLLSPF